MLKLAVFDLDNTLAPVGKGMKQENLALLKELENKGVQIAISSGKPTFYTCGFLRQLELKNPIMVGENGSVIQFGVDLPPKKFYKLPYPREVKESLDWVRKEIENQIPSMWFQPNEVEVTPFPYKEEEFEVIAQIIKENQDRFKGIKIYRHFDCYDFLPENIDKGVGLMELAKLLGLALDEVAVVGDSINDYEMFACAGTSIGISLAEPERVDVPVENITEALNYLLQSARN